MSNLPPQPNDIPILREEPVNSENRKPQETTSETEIEVVKKLIEKLKKS